MSTDHEFILREAMGLIAQMRRSGMPNKQLMATLGVAYTLMRSACEAAARLEPEVERQASKALAWTDGCIASVGPEAEAFGEVFGAGAGNKA